MKALRYESLLREAFGYALNGEIAERWGDPAGIANTDVFDEMYIEKVKAGAAYAMEIFSNPVMNKKNLSDTEIERLEDFTKRVINADSIDTIDTIIEEFDTTVIQKYYDIQHGKITLK